ncbi:MAG: hypothetical protein GF331_05310, partial [Chitinivibrionales bacterium]|nr:hypothetical protein [Chitinivibrionales bacterium]
GYTLYTSAHAQRALLIGMDGRLVHEWHLPFDSVWDRSAAVARPPEVQFVYWRKAGLLPNGDLIAIAVEAGMTPWGLGLIRIDRSSRLVWKYLQRVHHDFHVADDGRVFTLTHRIRRRPLKGVPTVKTPFLDDLVVVLSPDGGELRRASVYEALAKSPYKLLLEHVPHNEHGDYLHVNAIELLQRPVASPPLRAGHLLLSMREIGFIGLVDTSSMTFTWGTTGPWLEQHDPDMLDNGNILLFDNRGRRGAPGGQSRVIEFDPVTHGIVWRYEGSEQERFYSEVRSSQQRLPNGNTLITESDAGRLLEVTGEGDIVWEFVNPAARDDHPGSVAAVCWATRVAESELDDAFARELAGSRTDGRRER